MTSKKLIEAWTSTRMKWADVGALDSEVGHAIRSAVSQVRKYGTVPNFTPDFWQLYEEPGREQAAKELARIAKLICKRILIAQELESRL